jgi:hypothetical protein
VAAAASERWRSAAEGNRMALLGPDEWPKTVDEAVERLLAILDDESKRRLRDTAEKDLILYHFGWGQGLRNDFGLWRGNSELLASCGCAHPDSASMVIIKAVWKRLQESAEP